MADEEKVEVLVILVGMSDGDSVTMRVAGEEVGIGTLVDCDVDAEKTIVVEKRLALVVEDTNVLDRWNENSCKVSEGGAEGEVVDICVVEVAPPVNELEVAFDTVEDE